MWFDYCRLIFIICFALIERWQEEATAWWSSRLCCLRTRTQTGVPKRQPNRTRSWSSQPQTTTSRDQNLAIWQQKVVESGLTKRSTRFRQVPCGFTLINAKCREWFQITKPVWFQTADSKRRTAKKPTEFPDESSTISSSFWPRILPSRQQTERLQSL